MSAGPLRRLVGVLGLLALLPTAALLTAGAITIEDAALRAGATLVAALALGKVAGWGLRFLAAEFERAEDGTGEQPDATPRRRAIDQPAAARRTGSGSDRQPGRAPGGVPGDAPPAGVPAEASRGAP